MVAASYDAGNRLTGKTITPATGVATTTTTTTTTAETYAYDGLGRLTQASNNSSNSALTYDSLGDTLSETQDGLTTTISYDALGCPPRPRKQHPKRDLWRFFTPHPVGTGSPGRCGAIRGV